MYTIYMVIVMNGHCRTGYGNVRGSGAYGRCLRGGAAYGRPYSPSLAIAYYPIDNINGTTTSLGGYNGSRISLYIK